MILLILAVISLIVALIRKGSFANLFDNELKAPYLFIVAILLFVALEVGDGAGISVIQNYAYVIMLVAYIVLLLSVVLNFNNFWMIPLLLGIILNFVVIFLNGGKMPVAESAMKIAGLSAETVAASSTMYVADAGTSLSFLGGIIPVPLPSIFASVLSAGTVLIAIGMFAVIQNLMLGIVYEYEDEEDEEEAEYEGYDEDEITEDEPVKKKKRGLFGRKKDDEEEYVFDEDEDDDDVLFGKNYADEDIKINNNEEETDILDKILGREENTAVDNEKTASENDSAQEDVKDTDDDFDENELEESFTGSLSAVINESSPQTETDETEKAEETEEADEESEEEFEDINDLFGGESEEDEKPELFGFDEELEGDIAEADGEEELFKLSDEVTQSSLFDDAEETTEEETLPFVTEEAQTEDSAEDFDFTPEPENIFVEEPQPEKETDVLKRAEEILENVSEKTVYEEEPEAEAETEPQMPIDVDSPYIIVNSRIVENPYYKFRKGEKTIAPESGEDMTGGVYVMKTRNPSTTGRPSFSPPNRTVNTPEESEDIELKKLNAQSASYEENTSKDGTGYEKVEMNIGDVQIRFWKKDNEEDN